MTTTTTFRRYLGAVAMTALLVATAACGGGNSAAKKVDYAPEIDPAQFSTTIDNPYLPFKPGTRTIYEGDTAKGRERIVVEVTRETKTVMGVTCVVVRDTVTLNGSLIEDTFDWYAQHSDGTVWYFGEDTTEFENGKAVNNDGAWEAGVDGAQPGVVMKADPQVGDSYRQEFYPGEAEDEADVLSVSEKITVPYGSYTDVVKTKDYTALEPDVVEHKYYARGIGFVFVKHVKGPAEEIGLVKVEQF